MEKQSRDRGPELGEALKRTRAALDRARITLDAGAESSDSAPVPGVKAVSQPAPRNSISIPLLLAVAVMAALISGASVYLYSYSMRLKASRDLERMSALLAAARESRRSEDERHAQTVRDLEKQLESLRARKDSGRRKFLGIW